MKRRIFAVLFLCTLFIPVGGDARGGTDVTEKPVWTLEFLKVRPEKYALALDDLDDQWMPIREEAKRQGAILSYERISNAGLVTPDHKISIVLLTEYKSMATYVEREELFASIREHLPSNTPPGMLRLQREDVFETDEHLFLEVPAEGNRQRLLLPVS